MQIILTQQLIYGFYSKDEATDLDANNDLDENKAKLFVSDGNNSILKNATVAVSLKYISNFW